MPTKRRHRVRACRHALLASVLPFLPHPASAQTAPPAQSAPDVAPPATADIVVTGKTPDATSTIDRKSYKVANDLQSAGGSASDVLQNIPAVDVDAQGNISLRGDTNVQILIDGKPSTTLTNANRGDALEQLPANTIDHVEVITNPSARFKPDGSAGIINIVTRKDRKPGVTASANLSAGTDGRFNAAVNAGYHRGPLTATASATLHRDYRWRPFTDRRTDIDPATGLATLSTQDSLFYGPKLSRTFTGGVDYDLTKHDTLSASGSYTHRTGTPQGSSRNVTYSPAGAVTSDFARSEIGHENEVSDEASLKYRHDFADKDHAFTLDLRRGETIENEIRRFADIYTLPAGLMSGDQQIPRLDTLERELTAEYSQPLAGGKLLLGYDLERDDTDLRNRGDVIDPATGIATPDPARTNHFTYAQTIHAFYATYDRKLGENLSSILGLRLEQTNITTDQITLGLIGHQSYFRAYPTLHLDYDLSHGQDLKFSFSDRVVRPDPEDLDPFPVFSDPLNLRAGNPNLKPQETRSLEAAYSRERRGLTLEATAFLRLTTNQFTQVSRFITPIQLLTTHENLGSSKAYGLDFSANGTVTPAISYRVSGTLSHSEINAANLGFAGTHSLFGATAKGGVDVKLSRIDFVQINATFVGRRLTPQGYRLPSVGANFGYRHRFRNGLTAVMSVSDIFNSQRERSVIDSATIVEASSRRNVRRVATLALSLPLRSGSKAPTDPKFEFDN